MLLTKEVPSGEPPVLQIGSYKFATTDQLTTGQEGCNDALYDP